MQLQVIVDAHYLMQRLANSYHNETVYIKKGKNQIKMDPNINLRSV